ncbi:hypothetical protein LTR78_008170 [Recurvomyces mirabilis]|uniref:Nucleoside transporter FUN26 n=1 Tax=Recurvomyces mirabilis TaxID=574656 RepID=A0AAE0TU34_9PEZI|nr:hypothetical protein LTR78_008170 [Recurvomyces mirabilis]KAK5150631.1 hypothetical protein LTS14_009914 [Recurvomyces mirabilis]
MDRLKKLWRGEQPYEPLEHDAIDEGVQHESTNKQKDFSYVEYSIFVLLGVSMLWAWNMFLAAGPYFQHRFRSNDWISQNFQAAELVVSNTTTLCAMLVLTRLQAGASYPKRIISSLAINMVVFTLLALFTKVGLGMSAEGYFGFLMVIMFAASMATGLCQNGIFAYVSGFGQPAYTQGIMTGQAIAGVLPCIAQIISVVGIWGHGRRPPPDDGAPPPGPPPVNPNSAFSYFLTATIIAAITLTAFTSLLARNRQLPKLQDNSTPDLDPVNEPGERKQVPLSVLFRKLFWLASAVFATFGITMMFPVFTQQIVSVRPHDQQSPLLQPPSFIPLAFLFWNTGDLLGRLATAVPGLSLIQRPGIVFGLAVSRVAFVGLYHLCNIRDRGAIVESDFFYLVIVQLLFGLTNGYVGSTCMIGAGEWVDPDEREAAGGFMGLCLVAGLTVGSFASFFAAGA